MTANVVQLVTLTSRSQIDEWLIWLRNNLYLDRRPGEWSHETWLFTGGPDNDRTVLFRCTTKKCQSLRNTQGMCAACRWDLQRIGLPLDEFIAT